MAVTETKKNRNSDLHLLPPEELLASMHSLVKNVKIHQANNELVIKCVARFMQISGELYAEESEISIQIAKGTFYICGEKLPHRRGSALLVENLLKFMERRGIVGLRLYPAMLAASTEQIVLFAQYLNESLRQKNPLDWLVIRFEESKLQWVVLLQPEIGGSTDAAIGLGRGGIGRGSGKGGLAGDGGDRNGGEGIGGSGGGTGSGGSGSGSVGGTGTGAGGIGTGNGGPGSGGGGAGTGAGAIGTDSGGLGSGGAGTGTGVGGSGSSGGGTGTAALVMGTGGGGPGTGGAANGTGVGATRTGSSGSGSKSAGGGVSGGEGRESRSQLIEVPGQRSPRRLYAYALEAMREVSGKISGNQRAGIRNAVRIVQNMVEEVTLQEHPLLLAMSTVRVYDDYTFSHSVNVAILSMFLGKKIGVNKDTLECLGICGLFHDLGKVLVPVEIFNKSTPLTADELAAIQKHSLNSTRLIMRLRASAKRKSAIVMPPMEHHLRYDLTGYPNIGWKKPLSLCGRILSICDHFDALTSPRVYRDHAFSADQALGMMLGMRGQAFDPLLLKVFVNILGVYPIGTLLELDNGDIGLVCRSPDTQVMSRPWVLILYPDGRGGYVKGEEVNLAAKDKAGYYFRAVVGSTNPILFNIQPAEFLT